MTTISASFTVTTPDLTKYNRLMVNLAQNTTVSSLSGKSNTAPKKITFSFLATESDIT